MSKAPQTAAECWRKPNVLAQQLHSRMGSPEQTHAGLGLTANGTNSQWSNPTIPNGATSLRIWPHYFYVLSSAASLTTV